MAFCSTCALFWATIALIAFFLFKKCSKCQRSTPRIRKTDWKEGTVYLYQFPRPKKMANLSPFCVKIEMFLRINNIPYENCFSMTNRSKYGLAPFIELNGVQYADSELIVEKLKELFKIKPLEDPREEAFARSLDRLLDNHTFPILMKYKKLDNMPYFVNNILTTMNVPEYLIPVIFPLAQHFLKGKAEKRIYTMLGPFSDPEFHMLLKKDLDAVRNALGKNKFLMGDEITAVDCTVFGQLSTISYMEIDTEVKRIVREEYPTIQEYLDRIVTKVFPAEFA